VGSSARAAARRAERAARRRLGGRAPPDFVEAALEAGIAAILFQDNEQAIADIEARLKA
jgi:hypothetical protein